MVFGLPDGDLLCEFGGPGSDPGRFNNPYQLCFLGLERLLVVDGNNKRLQASVFANYRFL